MERLSREFEKAEIDEDKVIRKLQRMEQSVFKDIEKDIFALFGRYATENNLTYEEAIRLLTSDEYRDFKMDVGSYIKTINNESVDEKAREKLELEYNTLAMKTRISRLEELTYRVNKNLDTLFFVTHRAVKELLEKSVTKSYNSAHTLKRDPSLRDKKLYKILEQPWSGANYSANIWNNRDKLAGIAQNEITKGIYQGKSAKKISKNISERLDASMKDIERVVRTESKHARNEASAQAYIDMGYEWYMFSSHTEGKSSERTCERCRKINEEKYRFDKRVVGENFPPLHPNCRCTIIPIVKDEMIENSRKEEYTEIKIEINPNDESEYRSNKLEVVTEEFKVTQNTIIARKYKDTSLEVYKSINLDDVNLKPKQLHNITSNIEKVAKMLKIKKSEIPKIIICSDKDFIDDNGNMKNTLASYNSKYNLIRIREIARSDDEMISAQKGTVFPYNHLSTYIHEFAHFLDAREFRRNNKIVGELTDEQMIKFNKWCNEKNERYVRRNRIDTENVNKISLYAKNGYKDKNYKEVYAEHFTREVIMRYMLSEKELERMRWLDEHAIFNDEKMEFEKKENLTEKEEKIFEKYMEEMEEERRKREEHFIKYGE